MRALISVSDKAGIADFAREIAGLGWTVGSTGGTLQTLQAAGAPAVSISDWTGFPEILDGRVKTLHPKIHGGILGRRDVADHRDQMAAHDIEPIDLVVVNLYPFAATIRDPGVSVDDAVEQIDIGGPTLIRAAAKNFAGVLIVVDPADYSSVLEYLKTGEAPADLRRYLAQKAFQHTATYDTAIAHYLRPADDLFPPDLTIALTKVSDLRYGENPHQAAALYADFTAGPDDRTGIVGARRLSGKEMSFNNIVDLDAAMGAVLDFAGPAVAIIKHTNPCGLSCHESLAEAYRRALSGDPVSAYGGIVASNRPIDRATAEAMKPMFYDAIVAPGFDPEGLEILKTKRNCLVVDFPVPPAETGRRGFQWETGASFTIEDRDGNPLPVSPLPFLRRLDFRRVSGGFLAQTRDDLPPDGLKLQVVTDRNPTVDELADLLFGWRAVKHVKSNAIVLAKDRTLLGMGAGQPNRVTSVRLAVERAGERAPESVLASDAFFPFPDGVETAAQAGATAVIQPGGSVRDGEVIEMANRHDIAMVFTGQRHFRH